MGFAVPMGALVIWEIFSRLGIVSPRYFPAPTTVAWTLADRLVAGDLGGDLLVTLMFRTRLDFVFEPLGVLSWLAISITLGVVASFVPAWHASRHPVREALAHE